MVLGYGIELQPVSYTHLDVYKRQLLGAGLRRGGLLGVVGAALGGWLLSRGLGGHHPLKRTALADPLAPGAEKARYAHMPLDSEVHSPDFATQSALPDTTPMGHERSAR